MFRIILITLALSSCASNNRNPASYGGRNRPLLTTEVIKSNNIKWCQGSHFSFGGGHGLNGGYDIRCDDGKIYNVLTGGLRNFWTSARKRSIENMEKLGGTLALSWDWSRSRGPFLFSFDAAYEGKLCAGQRISHLGEIQEDGDFSTYHSIALNCGKKGKNKEIEITKKQEMNSKQIAEYLKNKYQLKLLHRMKNDGMSYLTFDIYSE